MNERWRLICDDCAWETKDLEEAFDHNHDGGMILGRFIIADEWDKVVN